MREVPECLNRRYKALDDLIQELSMAVAASSRADIDFESQRNYSDDPSIRLMCEFWDILKEDPDCNLTQAVKHRMGLTNTNSTVFGPRHVTCYMAGSGKKCGGNKKCCGLDPSKDNTPGESEDGVRCKKCSAKDETPKNDDTSLKIKDSVELLKIHKEAIHEKPPKVTPTVTPKVASSIDFDPPPPPPYKICCKDKLERMYKERLTPKASQQEIISLIDFYQPPTSKICCKAKRKYKEKRKPTAKVTTPKASRESARISIPSKEEVKESPAPKICCQDKAKEPMSPSRDRVKIRVPRNKDPSKDKLKEIGTPKGDGKKVKPKDSKERRCKVCSVLEKIKSICGSAKSVPKHDCGQGPPPKTDSSPLSKALCNLKQAASHDKQCNDKIKDLLLSQTQLKDQIQKLEQRETQGLQMLKKADCMWTCMEDCYKKKLSDSQQRHKEMLKELKQVEQNNYKWRKNSKELEFQMNTLNKLQQEMTEKINQKKNDTKIIDAEIDNLKKRVENYSKETDAIKRSMENRKNASNMRISTDIVDINKFQDALNKERGFKLKKEEEGAKYIKEARDDMQKICKFLLQKRLQNEDLRAEKKALEDEIELLRQALDQCRDKCGLKQKRMKDEIKRLTDEINNYQMKCIRCHQCTDTTDIRKLCTDCPKCERDRECKVEDEHCVLDPNMDCVCQSVKQKFLDNVFENMYTVLARQSKTGPGKAVADAILKCLRKSTNGKLNDETRQILQEFILTTVKKNLNLTIIGGAVKTRCEMDNETYEQLMCCLKDVQTIKPPKEDKGTAAKKASCRRWGGSNECNCPHGPKACICSKKAPPPLEEPGPNPPPDAEDPGEVVKCPHKKEKASCGVDCAMHAIDPKGNVGSEPADWKRDPCKSPTTCSTFSTNMRAAQCVLGPESLMNMPNKKNAPPVVPNFDDLISDRHDKHKKPCACEKDHRGRPRQSIIEEVMGKYTEVSPIEKVSNNDKIRYTGRCLCSRCVIDKQTHLLKCNCGSDWKALDGFEDLKQLIMQKRNAHICIIKQDSPIVKKVESPDNELKVLLHPKNYRVKKDKSMITNRVKNDKSMITDRLKNDKSVVTDHSKLKWNESHVSKIAKELMSDIIALDVNKKEYDDDPEVTCIKINNPLKEISSSHYSLADDSYRGSGEIEMDSESLTG